MNLTDRMTRKVSADAALNASTVSFNTPERALLKGEYVTLEGDTTEYLVSSPSNTSFGITPVLAAAAAFGVEITRFDKYAISDIDDIIDELAKEGMDNEGMKAFFYKKSLAARALIERQIGYVVQRSRTLTRSILYQTDKFFMPHLQTVSITSVTLNDSLTAVDTDSYTLLDNGIILFDFTLEAKDKIVIVYEEGFTEIPQDIIDMNAEVIKILFDQSAQGKDSLTVESNTGVANPELNQNFRAPDYLRKYIMNGLDAYRSAHV